MRHYDLLLWVLICLPFFGSLLLPFAGLDSERFRNVLAFLFLGVPLACAIALIDPISNKAIIDLTLGGVPLFRADMLALFMAFVSLLVGFIILIYSFDYISHYGNRSEYYFLVVIFLGSMMGLVFSRNLLLIYLFWEVTALASWRLIGFYREKVAVWRADKAFLITVFGALSMLAGFILIYLNTGSFDIYTIAERSGYTVPNTVVFLILVGILSKSATLPLHTWLPDAGVAPSPVTALLHAAVLVKIGVYVYARLFVAGFAIPPEWHHIVPLIAGISALVSGGAALIENDIKRIIAYSTVSQIGFILLGLSIGSEIGIGGALLFILMHGLAKGGLFLCAGIVEQNTHEKDITKLGGLIRTMPVTAIAFLLCAFSIMGIPPFGGFFSKYMVMSSAIQSGQTVTWLLFLAAAFITIIYLFRTFSMVFLGAPVAADSPEASADLPSEGGRLMVWSVAVLGALSLLSGLLIQFPNSFVQMAVIQMLKV